ncbi:MAG: hypothetical protein Q6370_022090 [Candidatus Sigynarchaeota archaeon]
MCKTLGTKPSPRATRLILLASLVLMLVAYAVMGYYFVASGDATPMLTSQLSFSEMYLKWQYSLMSAAGLENYRIAQCFDYLYMVSYGMFAFALALIIGRKFGQDTTWRKSGCLFAVLGPVAACCDAVENAFILLTLSDPTGFPAWWAIAHSTFAAVKWILLLVAIGWVLLATLYYLLVVKRKK